MKLRVVELLLVTTVPALFLATNGTPDLSLTFWSLLGGTLAAGQRDKFQKEMHFYSLQLFHSFH